MWIAQNPSRLAIQRICPISQVRVVCPSLGPAVGSPMEGRRTAVTMALPCSEAFDVQPPTMSIARQYGLLAKEYSSIQDLRALARNTPFDLRPVNNCSQLGISPMQCQLLRQAWCITHVPISAMRAKKQPSVQRSFV